MIKAAGIIMREPGGKVLLLRRDDDCGWDYPGGKLEDGENAEQAACREAQEEIGKHDEGRMTHLMRRVDDVDYTTFLMRVPSAFEPDKLTEHTEHKWILPADALKELDLHPGVDLALKRLSMNELDVAKAIANGTLQSPQFYRNMWLFAIRITGTGLSYRGGLKEYVWRDQGLYLNDEFLERCQGLAVVWVHPDSATLDSKEFAERVIGSVMVPYIKGEEVWGVAKIYDDEAASEMLSSPISTSPGVSWDDPSVNSMVKFDGGKKLLIEGDPSLLDHIAVVKNGVWDKGGDPTGVQNDIVNFEIERADSMTPEEQAAADAARKDAEEKARKDADAGAKLDKMLSHLDSIGARLDAFEAKEKAREDAARKDAEDKAEAERKDAASRRDAEHEEFKKADAAMCAKDDEDEAKEAKELEEKGEPKEVAADKARKARKDRMDARRKDAEEKEEEEKKDAARKDAVHNSELAEVKRQLAALQAMTASVSDADRIAMADEQARVDTVYRSLGQQAPFPMAGETINAYRVRSHRGIQTHSKKWAKIDLHKLPAEAMDPILAEIRNDAMDYARAPDDLEPGQLRPIVKVDPSTGQRQTTFVGKGTFIGQMKRPSRHVSRINTKF